MLAVMWWFWHFVAHLPYSGSAIGEILTYETAQVERSQIRVATEGSVTWSCEEVKRSAHPINVKTRKTTKFSTLASCVILTGLYDYVQGVCCASR